MNRASLDRDTKDAQYRYSDVKSHLNNIKNSEQRLKDMDTDNIVDPSYVSSKYQGPATSDDLGADIGFYRNRRASDRDFLHNSIKDNQDYINNLLRRDESLTESYIENNIIYKSLESDIWTLVHDGFYPDEIEQDFNMAVKAANELLDKLKENWF